MAGQEWRTDEKRVREYLERADQFPRRSEGDTALLELLPEGVERVLDLGTGGGYLLDLVGAVRPEMRGVGLDFSELMLAAARERFEGEERIELVEHDMEEELPELGPFDAVVSAFAIHHLEDERKRSLYREVFELLEPGGVFVNCEHVAAPTERLHAAFFEAIDEPLENEDPSDRTVAVETQLGWLREIGFDDVDCHWKWREMAVLTGTRPAGNPS